MQSLKSKHQTMVELFMLRAKQEVPVQITSPSIGGVELSARIMVEEMFETLKAMGVELLYDGKIINLDEVKVRKDNDHFDIVEFIDGCCDIAVVTTSALSRCGVPDEPFQTAVNENNLRKFVPGHSIREDGKLLKPPGHQPPNIRGILHQLTGHSY